MKQLAHQTSAGTAVKAGATATGAAATGTLAVGTLVAGALAMGALAVGALAIGRLAIGRARIGRVEIGELRVRHLELGDGVAPGPLIAVTTVRAAPGQGDALERLLHAQATPGALLHRGHRSTSDPDRFLFYERFADRAAYERQAQSSARDAFRRRIAEAGLADDAVEVELYRAI